MLIFLLCEDLKTILPFHNRYTHDLSVAIAIHLVTVVYLYDIIREYLGTREVSSFHTRVYDTCFPSATE
jgi:hypothetical protein